MNQVEVLVINDGSKDNSSAIAHKYENEYPSTFSVIDKENGNYGSCINVGLSRARGKYFRILDADDRLDRGALATLLGVLGNVDVDMVFTRCMWRDSKGRLIKDIAYPDTVKIGSVIAVEDFDAAKIGYWPFVVHMVTYKTAVLQKSHLSLTEGISYTDNEFLFYPMDKVKTMWFENIAVYQYTIGREGQTMTPHLMKRRIGHFEIILKRMLAYYNTCSAHIPNAVLSNQQGMIFSIMRWMYYLALHSPATAENKRILKSLDAYSEQYVEFKDEVDNIEQYGFKYVEYWHKTGRNCCHPITYALIQVNRLSKKISSLLK